MTELGPVSILSQPDEARCDGDHGEEGLGQLLMADRETPEVFELAEEALNEVSFVKRPFRLFRG